MRKNPKNHSMVSDQPGRFIFWGGLLICYILSSLLKFQITPEKISEELKRTSRQIHKSLDVDFESARLIFAKGWLPRFSLEVKNVRMVSNEACWLQPLINIKTLELPLSLVSFLKKRSPISDILIDDARVYFRGMPNDCKNDLAINIPEMKDIPKPESIPLGVSLAESQSRASVPDSQPGEIEKVVVDRFHVAAKDIPIVDFYLNNFELKVKTSMPRIFHFKAQTNFFKDHHGQYLSHALIEGNYKEFPETLLSFAINGNWREGSYFAKAEFDAHSRKYKADGEFRHLPLGTVLEQIGGPIPTRQAWLSFRIQTNSDLSKGLRTPVEISKFVWESDFGDAEVPDLKIKSLDPLLVESTKISLKKFDLDQVIERKSNETIAKTFKHYGLWSGEILFDGSEKIQFSGDLQSTEINFTSQNNHAVQKVLGIRTQGLLHKKNLNLNLTKFEIENGSMDGKMELNWNFQNRTTSARVNLRKIELSPESLAVFSEDRSTTLSITGFGKSNEKGELEGNFDLNSSRQKSRYKLVGNRNRPELRKIQ